ncbi:dihydroxyacetone kinase subunit L [Leminorella grimontii]|uniref:Dihydroxyacetone kinase subunit L n=1 Tax=Leminorella grimontii TaxID=82981 RepID=A0AAV5N884_9GAMM|nr:dihydroxyacetone kinase subunit DhaL [Leminorella grimontii]KFC94970.1 putative ADP-binding subunit of dihydroxyacetone kinase [Leminorella grimontii ATCC 33999 = DSM 5078]GKX56937.1 dihydroxyacetone kinase subunit L [Leminorella grimontii]VFS61191.1 PTS-dependent dihydroxyacetone kinase, ADP-binding subunit dhaL [Leminorella grimontii]
MMDLTTTRNLMRATAEKMVASEPELTRLDQVIGDGDHGLGMKRGFAAVVTLLDGDSCNPDDVGALLLQIGTRLMSSMGGASGAIFGTMFRAGGKAVAGEPALTTPVLARFLTEGLNAVFQRGGAKKGDKTMVDALTAAVEKANALGDMPLNEALPQIAEAARQGADSTKDQVAVFGRAKTLGERSLGHVDPGAVSMSLILTYMAEGV